MAVSAALLLGLGLQGCSSGSGGSDVGAHAGVAPTARAQILNGGPSGALREGSEVLLTGKASEDGDGPLIAWTWRQTAGPKVRLIEANATTVSFTAPRVSAATRLTFELTVEDSTKNTGSASIDVTVLPGRDSDKFLSLDVRTGPTFDAFAVVAALHGGATTGATPKPFTLSARAYLVYPPRTAANADCTFNSADFAGGIPASTASGCLVSLLEDLTPQPLPTAATGVAGEWPAGVNAPEENADARVARWWNPRFSLRIPRLDVHEFNQQYVDGKQRDRLLDGFAAHRSRIILALSLTAPENQRDATLILPDLIEAPISLPEQSFAPQRGEDSKIIENGGSGLSTAAIIPLETLLAAIGGREAALTSEVYYRTVDPNNTRATLNAWLRQAGFTTPNGALQAGCHRGVGRIRTCRLRQQLRSRIRPADVHAHGRVRQRLSFVKNYQTLEGAIRQLDSFATVVTEYSPLVNHTDPTPKFVKFFTYVEDGSGDAPRVASFDFDGRGERFTPGNCTSCHGGARPPGVSELIFDTACGDRPTRPAMLARAQPRRRHGRRTGISEAASCRGTSGSLLFADTDPAIVRASVAS